MIVDEVRAEVDRILTDLAGDDEAQHAAEDALLAWLVRAYAPGEVVAQVRQLAAADFERWCA